MIARLRPLRPPRCTCSPSPAANGAAYDKRKYMWKLLYTRLLGYDVDFGLKNASDLIAAPGWARQQPRDADPVCALMTSSYAPPSCTTATKRVLRKHMRQAAPSPGPVPTVCYDTPAPVLPCRYAEKQVGYVACSVFLNEVRRLRLQGRSQGLSVAPARVKAAAHAGCAPALLRLPCRPWRGAREPPIALGCTKYRGSVAFTHALPQLAACVQKDEFLRLVINSVRNDLISRNEAFQCLALDFVANGARWRGAAAGAATPAALPGACLVCLSMLPQQYGNQL